MTVLELARLFWLVRYIRRYQLQVRDASDSHIQFVQVRGSARFICTSRQRYCNYLSKEMHI